MPILTEPAQLARIVEANYADGISQIIDGADAVSIAQTVFDQDGDMPDPQGLSAMFVTWGQFIDHDLDLTRDNSGELVTVLGGGDLSAFQTLPDRLLQSHVNALLAMRMMTGAFKDDPQFFLEGQSTIDPDERYYWGASLGGIMGGVYMTVSPDVARGGLGVPGQSFNLLLSRSVLFSPFFDVLIFNYADPLDISLFLAAAMLLWDRAEPTGFTSSLRGGELTDGFGHEVLIQGAMGDHQVTNLGTHMMARAIGAPIHTPEVGASDSNHQASSAEPIGSMSVATDTVVGAIRSRAKLIIVWPSSCGPITMTAITQCSPR